jgi:uncharacterized lipoprotein YajG
MKAIYIALIGAAILLQTGCVTGRRSLTPPIPSHTTQVATLGSVYISTVKDDRQFENKPSDPSIPSIDGDVTKLSAAEKDRMIGRQRNTFGKAMGDISLDENDSVTQRVRMLITEALGRKGYQVTQDPASANTVAVAINEFWAWGTPGVFALAFEVKIKCTVAVTEPAGSQTLIVKGYGINHGQVAKNENWLEAFDPAFEDFIANFDEQWGTLPLSGHAVASAK